MSRLSRVVPLLCPVRGCGLALTLEERAYVCPRRHSFDRARSGYVNLLTPQDRRSPRAGDSKAAVEARRRFLAAGHEAPFLMVLQEAAGELALPRRAAILDVGCGTGYHLGAVLAARPALELAGHGLDLSVPAIERAAREHPEATWVVANADRFLPYAAGAFHLAWSLTARRPAAELARILAADGALLVAVPGPEDLVELRAAVLGQRVERDRVETTVAALAGAFALAGRRAVRWQVELSAAEVGDALAATYRGARFTEREKSARLGGMTVTLSRDLLLFRPRSVG